MAKDANGNLIRPATHKEGLFVFKRYIALLYRLVVIEKNDFDLIVGSGDSGAVMAKIAELFYKKIRRPCPPILCLPIQRYSQLGVASGQYFEGNKKLIPEIKKDLRDLKKLENILFVDDEIWKAWTAKTSIELIIKALPKNKMPKRLLYTIVAENHGFEWHYDIPPTAIRYYSFSKKIPGVNGSIFEILPDTDWKALDGQKLKIAKRPFFNIFLLGFTKANIDGRPSWSTDLAEQVKRNKRFKAIKSKNVKNINTLISQAIKEYKQGEIVFKF